MVNHIGGLESSETRQPSTPAVSALTNNLRRSERVSLSLPIRISGIDEYEKDFSEECCTVDVSQHGATIIVDRELSLAQNIKIRRIDTSKEAVARVIGRKERKPEGRTFGMAFIDNGADLWDIEFPTAPSPEEAVLRALLRCAMCGRLQLARLNEFESDLFLGHHSLARLCSRCSAWTVWVRPYAPLLSVPGQPVVPWGSQNHRSFERIRTEAVGCVRHPDLGNDVVVVTDLGRGGLSFYTANTYSEGQQIEMAVPYSNKAPNVFLTARIVGLRKAEDKGLMEYRAAYLV